MANNGSVGVGQWGVDRSGAVAAAEARRRALVRMTLIQMFHLESAFIGVPKLARILGVTPNTIWSYMRQKKFFIPYRMFNTTPMVCIDDLVEWYCSRDGLWMAAETSEPLFHDYGRIQTGSRDAGPPDGQDEVDSIVADALAALGLDSKTERGPRRRP